MPLAALTIDVAQKESVDPDLFRLRAYFPHYMHIWGEGIVLGKEGLFLINSSLVLWIESHGNTFGFNSIGKEFSV